MHVVTEHVSTASVEEAELSADALSPRRWGCGSSVVEVERHASEAGWDQPARLFALVPTDELVAAEPELAAELGISDGTADLFTPVEQELDEHAGALEELLERISWPPIGRRARLAVVERVVLPPEAEEAVPDDPGAAGAYAAAHPDREDVRIAVGVLRSGRDALRRSGCARTTTTTR